VEKAFEMGKTSATGSFQLLIGVALSTIIQAVETIVLGKFLFTTDEFGLYGIVLVPSMLINLFRDLGINSAMTRYIASLRVSHRDNEIHEFIMAGIIFEVVSGIAFSLLSLFLASFIASTIFRRPESAQYIAIVSFSIISGSLLAASQAGFIGFERMKLNSLTLILQATVKTVTGLTLVFLGYKVLGAVIGYTLGYVAAGTIGISTFYLFLLRPLRKKLTENPSAHSANSMSQTLRTMLDYGIPISISTTLAGILTQIYSFMIIPLNTNTAYADYIVASYFTVLLTFFTTPIATVLFPTFAKLDPKKEHELVKNVFTSSTKYTSILVVPAAMILMALSGPIVGTLFRETYANAPFFLTISVLSTLFVLIGSVSAISFLSGLGETRTLMKQNAITIAVGIPLGIILIPTFGITGLIVAGILAMLPSTLWVLHWIWKNYEAKADFQSSAKILVASAIAALMAYLSTYLSTRFLNMTDWIKLIIGLAFFLTVYVLGAPLIGAVNLSDIRSLRTMLSGLPIISRIMDIPFRAAEKAARIKPANRKTTKKP
jgi:stage V sporulation protein B